MTFLENVDKTKLQKITLIVISALVLTALALLLVIIIMSISTNATTVEIDNKVLFTGSLVLADEDHPYTVDASNLDLVEGCQTYRNNQLIADGIEATKANYPYIAYAGMQLTTPAMEAAHRMLSDAKEAVGQKALTIDAAYGLIYNTDTNNEEFKTGNLMFISDYLSESGAHVPLSKEYREWFDANAYKYGFIESFEDGYRYVGVAHAKLMKDKNITTLADYIAYLKKNTNADKMISVKVGNEEYSVYYVACKAGDKVRVPLGADYTVSGTNEGGVVITIKK